MTLPDLLDKHWTDVLTLATIAIVGSLLIAALRKDPK